MNIVSIDFDIIMQPSIEYYNGLADNTQIFSEPLMKMCEADLSMYHKLSLWLFSQAKYLSPQDIIFIENHHDIIKHIPENENISLINIDHHHDVGYSFQEEKITNENLNCGNWGKYLLQNKKINNYIWLCNKNSNKNNFSQGVYHHLSDFNLNNLFADKIIICLSPPWIPHQYKNLFFNWMTLMGLFKDTNYYFN